MGIISPRPWLSCWVSKWQAKKTPGEERILVGSAHISAAEKAVWSWIFGLNLEFPCFGESKSLELMSCSYFCTVYFLFPFSHSIFKTMWNVHSSHGEWIQQQLKHIILLCMEGDAGHLLTQIDLKGSFWLLCGEDTVAGKEWKQEGRPSKRLFQLSLQKALVVWTEGHW